ncbi:MAG TPA: HAMP domain-containing sensor histidine kinase, partial [Candidatus Acidoferrales bacterium]|nr:HAMP domain-containing sensor histidine kinase [Candidatus Acidoferrales bacterium]
MLEASSGKSAHKGIEVERRYEYHGTIEANEGAIREVFTNLVLNALEAVPRRDGRLTVRTSAWTRSNGKDVAGVRIVFEDNGPGIPDAHKQKVFEPLFSTKKGTGTGLGLWVSERLVHQQHGALWLESKKNSH